MENKEANKTANKHKWKKVAYGGQQPGYDDNHVDESFLEGLVMNANVVKRDLFKVMLDSISISQYICISSLVVFVWIQTLHSAINETFLLSLDACLLILGFLIVLLTTNQLSFHLFLHYAMKIFFFICGLYILAPVYYTLTRSISSDSIWALSASLLLIHLFFHDYSGYTVRPPGEQNNPTLASNISLNASIISSVLIASRLPSWLHVFALMLFSLQVFLFAPLVTFCIKKHSFRLHIWLSFVVMAMTLYIVCAMSKMLFIVLLALLVFISVICPYWLIQIQEYKFEINGPWDEAKLCFEITE